MQSLPLLGPFVKSLVSLLKKIQVVGAYIFTSMLQLTSLGQYYSSYGPRVLMILLFMASQYSDQRADLPDEKLGFEWLYWRGVVGILLNIY